jgi:uncharacterized SAM-binding protein YcdF (DUF218 family)
MFFVLSKLFWFFFGPVNFLLTIGLAGIVLAFTRFKRTAHGLAYFSIIALTICAFFPIGPLLLRPLEDRFPSPPADLAPPTGIIVLGGSLDQGLSDARNQIALNEAGTRLTSAVELARRFPQAKLVFTGGSASLSDSTNEDFDTNSEARGVKRFWTSLGLPPDRAIYEGRSRNTWENAVFTCDLMKPKPGETWLLVTSAWHMPRSVGIFRKVGFDIVPYPVDFRTYGDSRDHKPSTVVIDELTMLTFAVHEWVGLIAYRLSGKIDAFLPGPL